jgi:hypothetical protein
MNLIIHNPAIQMSLMNSSRHSHSHGNADHKVLLACLIVFTIVFLISVAITIFGYKTKLNYFNDPFWEYFFTPDNILLMIINICGFIVWFLIIFGYLSYLVYNLLI